MGQEYPLRQGRHTLDLVTRNLRWCKTFIIVLNHRYQTLAADRPLFNPRMMERNFMRSLPVLPVAVAVFFGVAVPAQAEKRTFIIANNPDGYGVERCLASGHKCGAPMANAFCRSRKFKRAAWFRQAVRGEITAAKTQDAYACVGRRCEQFVAIECVR
jgi:hypothetical protein